MSYDKFDMTTGRNDCTPAADAVVLQKKEERRAVPVHADNANGSSPVGGAPSQ